MKKLNLQEILENTSNLSSEKKVWYVTIIGRPNSWKSTFINNLIWEKISITTNIPQTTRKKILAIYNDEKSQIVFFDTPWIHKSNKNFNEEINKVAISSFKDADLILYFIDSSREWWEEENYIKKIIEFVNKPIIKVYTKSDLVPKINIPQNENIIQISSISKNGFDILLNKINIFLKKWPLLFPEDYYTKQDMYFRISEIIREKIFFYTKEEIPHSIYVWVEEIQDKENLLKIISYIYTESDSQKYIIIWKSWNLLQKIWKESRVELENIFWKKVFLALRVKTQKNWRKNEKLVKDLLY